MNELWRPQHTTSETAAAAPGHPRSIVFLGTAHDHGGSSVLASTLADAMRSDGHHVEEWYLFGSKADRPPGARVFVEGTRSRSPLTLAALFVRVVLALRRLKPDAAFGLQPLSNLLVAIAGWLAGVPDRVATHHLPSQQFNSVLMIFDGVVGRLGLYRHIVACGHSVANSYRHNGAAYMRRLTVIPNGHRKPVLIDRAKARNQFKLPVEGPVLGQLGRLYHQKNQCFSIGLLRDLPEASLLMIGSGPDEAVVKSAIATGGFERRAHLMLSIAHDRIGEFYSAIDVALFPSSFEGLSLAAIEAIHASVPLVCSDIPSFREMFRNSPFLAETLLVPLGDREAWLNRVRAILSDKKLRLRIVAELRRLSPAYAFETMAAKYLSVID
jgi:glycosyltransferase involved in cell wall biosynthesis